MAYAKQTWVNGVVGGTPLSAARLNHIEDGIEVVSATSVTAIQSPGGQVSIDPYQLRADRAAAPLTTPTFDGSGEAVHPSVLYFPEKWNGWHYWMAMTPYPASVGINYENPSILVSQDGNTWSVPVGLTNPIDTNPGNYFPDSDLIMVGETMWCYYNTGPHYAKYSTDGINWSARQTLTVAGTGMSPSIAAYGDDLYLWSVDSVPNPNVLNLYKSTTGMAGVFALVGACTFAAIPARDVWHIQVRLVGDQFIAAWLTSDTGGAGSTSALHIATSRDGLAWDLNPAPIMSPLSGVWDKYVYRSSLVSLDGRGGNVFDLFYSAQSAVGTSAWHIGRTTIQVDSPGLRAAQLFSPLAVGVHYPSTLTLNQRIWTYTLNQPHYAPCFTDRDIWIDQLAVNVQTGGTAGAIYRMGIYLLDNRADPFKYAALSGVSAVKPYGTLLLDAGTVDVTSTGIKTITFTPVRIPAGWFAVAGVSQVATAVIYAGGDVGVVPRFSPFGLHQGGYTGTPYVAFIEGGVSGALNALIECSSMDIVDGGVTYRRSA